LRSLFDEFRALGIHFVVTTQNTDTTRAFAQLQLHILGALAEFECNIISERTKESIEGNSLVGNQGPDKKPRKKGGCFAYV
jgi:DNA invertase Pin-like site-specific DNA recombinase